MVKIIIKLTNEEFEHLEVPHAFMDECSYGCDVLYKVQKEIEKIKRKNTKDLKRKKHCINKGKGGNNEK